MSSTARLAALLAVLACKGGSSAPPARTRHYTFRAIGGVSMGPRARRAWWPRSPARWTRRGFSAARSMRRWDGPSPAQAAHGPGRLESARYQSAALGGPRDFSVTLPPGYDDPANAGQRYPVLLMLHGYGQTPDDFSTTSALVDLAVSQGLMRQMILAYPDGRCCYRGPAGRACTEDANGKPGYTRECARGSFFVNHPGVDGARYGDATLEVFDEVDKRYRTLPPRGGPL